MEKHLHNGDQIAESWQGGGMAQLVACTPVKPKGCQLNFTASHLFYLLFIAELQFARQLMVLTDVIT
jgi:hypothetical protein